MKQKKFSDVEEARFRRVEGWLEFCFFMNIISEQYLNHFKHNKPLDLVATKSALDAFQLMRLDTKLREATDKGVVPLMTCVDTIVETCAMYGDLKAKCDRGNLKLVKEK